MHARHLLTTLLAAAALAAAPAPAAARASFCIPGRAGGVPQVGAGATQAVTVDAPTARSTRAAVRLWGIGTECWERVGGPWPARVGRGGLSAHRREGDGTTPLGVFRLGTTVYGLAPDPGVKLRYHRLACGDWWDGDSASPTYNRFRHVACDARPRFTNHSEALWTYTVAYPHFVPIAFNTRPTVPHRGSAIFLHASTGRPTAGCISLPLAQLRTLLRWLDPRTSPLIQIRVAPRN